jgi:hypothetical protein
MSWALWRAARAEAEDLVSRHPDPLYADDPTASQVNALWWTRFSACPVSPFPSE